jgi:hypothetical protein
VKDGALLLWDEFCGNGGHSTTVLSQWLSLKDDTLDEDLVEALGEDLAKKFRSTECALIFALARQSGMRNTRRFIEKHGLTRVSVLEPTEIVPDVDTVFSGSGVFLDEHERDEVREFLEDVGLKLLAKKKTQPERPWSDAKVEDCVLGYGNTAQLLVFYYNVPTVTLTALWEKCSSWMPLFPRRPKLAVGPRRFAAGSSASAAAETEPRVSTETASTKKGTAP